MVTTKEKSDYGLVPVRVNCEEDLVEGYVLPTDLRTSFVLFNIRSIRQTVMDGEESLEYIRNIGISGPVFFDEGSYVYQSGDDMSEEEYENLTAQTTDCPFSYCTVTEEEFNELYKANKRDGVNFGYIEERENSFIVELDEARPDEFSFLMSWPILEADMAEIFG